MSAPRRNGQPSSCEPCRKSKLRCDHTIPICQRCSNRGKGHLCVYHPAPLTRRDRQFDVAEESAVLPESVIAPWENRGNSLKDRLVAGWSKKKSIEFPSNSTSTTSYSAILKEASISVDQDQPEGLSTSAPTDRNHIQLGAQILMMLEDFPVYKLIAENWWQVSEEGCVLGRPLFQGILTSLTEKFEAWTQNAKDQSEQFSSLLGMSWTIFNNTTKQLDIHSSTTPQEYVSIISLRWESIGLFFSVVGLGAILAPNWKSITDHEPKLPKDQRELGILATAVGDVCLQFCDSYGVITDPLCWLLFQHIHLLTVTYGDNDRRPWGRLADLSTNIFTLGINQSRNYDNLPFFLVELRKRLMSGALSVDKQLATLLGRPPQISRRFCNVEPPLDLSYEEIFALPNIRDGAIQSLDSQGWNTQGCLTQAAWLRVALAISPVREQVLELSLTHAEEDFSSRARELFVASHQIWNSLPEFLRWRQDGTESKDTSILIPLYLEFLYTDLLLYQMLNLKTQEGFDSILRISAEILSKVLVLLKNEFSSRSTTHNVSWNLVYFGIPSASVLAMHLLQRPSHPRTSQSSISSSRPSSSHGEEQTAFLAPSRTIDISNASFDRSEIIQNLSVFASYLHSAVRPHDGNYDICQQARWFIRKSLDQVLSPSFATEVSSPPSMTTTMEHSAALVSPQMAHSSPNTWPTPTLSLSGSGTVSNWLDSEEAALGSDAKFSKWVDDLNSEDFMMNSLSFPMLSSSLDPAPDQEML